MVIPRTLDKRSTTILIAAVLALGTGLLLFNYLSSVEHTAQTVPMRSVVVAAREIPPHTLIKPEMITLASRPADSVDPDVSTSVNGVAGQMTFIDIPAGSTLSTAKIGHLTSGGLTMRVPPGQRAVSIALDPVKGVADLVQAGDHVDVIAVTQSRGSDEVARVTTILRNKTILAMGTTMDGAPGDGGIQAAPGTGDAAVQTATLAVKPDEAKTLALADLSATLRLALRSPHDASKVEAGDAFVPGAPVVRAPVVAVAPPALAPAPKVVVVHAPAAPAGIPLIDGDRVIR